MNESSINRLYERKKIKAIRKTIQHSMKPQSEESDYGPLKRDRESEYTSCIFSDFFFRFPFYCAPARFAFRSRLCIYLSSLNAAVYIIRRRFNATSLTKDIFLLIFLLLDTNNTRKHVGFSVTQITRKGS